MQYTYQKNYRKYFVYILESVSGKRIETSGKRKFYFSAVFLFLINWKIDLLLFFFTFLFFIIVNSVVKKVELDSSPVDLNFTCDEKTGLSNKNAFRQTLDMRNVYSNYSNFQN